MTFVSNTQPGKTSDALVKAREAMLNALKNIDWASPENAGEYVVLWMQGHTMPTMHPVVSCADGSVSYSKEWEKRALFSQDAADAVRLAIWANYGFGQDVAVLHIGDLDKMSREERRYALNAWLPTWAARLKQDRVEKGLAGKVAALQ